MVLTVPALFLLTSCGGQGELSVNQADSLPQADPPLAQVGTVEVTERDFEFEMQRRVEKGRPIPSAEEVLHDLILRQAMLQRAEGSGILDDPNAKRERENQLLSQWLEQSLHKEKQNVEVSDQELRQYYEEHMDRYTRAPMIRLAVLMRRISPSDGAETVDALKNDLQEARKRYLEDPISATRGGRIPGFGDIASTSSEHTVSRYRGGDLGWMQEGKTTASFPQEVMDKGFSLDVGEVSDVMATEGALYVIMKTDFREGQVTPFEEAKSSLRRPLIRQKQDRVEQAFRSNLLASFEVSVNEEKVSRLSVPEQIFPEPPQLQTLNRPVHDVHSVP